MLLSFYVSSKKLQEYLDEFHESREEQHAILEQLQKLEAQNNLYYGQFSERIQEIKAELAQVIERQDKLEKGINVIKSSGDEIASEQIRNTEQITSKIEEILRQCSLLDEGARLLLINSIMDRLPEE